MEKIENFLKIMPIRGILLLLLLSKMTYIVISLVNKNIFYS